MPTSPASPADLAQVGRTGLRAWGGYIAEERHPQLTGSRWPRTVREIADNEAVVGAALHAIKALIRAVPWHAAAAQGDGVDAEDAERWRVFLESCMSDMSGPWSDHVSECLSEIEYGWDYAEIVYKIRRGPDEDDAAYRSAWDDGLVGWRKLQHVSQDTRDRWALDPDGGIRGLYQACDDGWRAFIPIERALLFRTQTTRGNPEGRSLLRSLWTSYHYAKRLREYEAIGAERDLAGLPVARLPPDYLVDDAPADKKAVYALVCDMVQQARQNERAGFVFPSAVVNVGGTAVQTGFDFQLMASAGARQFDTDRIIRRYESREAMVLLAEFLLLGTEPNGSRSLAESKTGLFAQSIAFILDGISEVHDRFGIPRLMRANAVPRKLWPRLAHGDIETVDPAVIGQIVQAFAVAGIPLGPEDERWLRDRVGMPPPEVSSEPDAREDGDEPVAAPVAAVPIAGVPEAVADTSLNGAQVASLLEIVRAVTAGEIPREAAAAIIVRAFGVSAADAEAMLGPAGFKPAEPPGEAAPPPAAPAA